ncbi:serine/threonine-protein kinase [Nonomuraea sp. SBT364]|uniref:serine/threonine-protein kinase n=1 Tax=Nonomuraea sp. SBT364 TaxID=1580530 RepID=UPI001E579FDE|nr:serine/threonine-protein kinase [Nonomuraea sp. SBT364]
MTPLAGRYRLLSQIGRGGMGTVWRAEDELLQQEVAVKEIRLPPGLSEADRAELTDRTLREARAAARLRSHPSIVTVHDVVVDDGRPWIVMEFVRGRSLEQVVRDRGPLPPGRVAAIGLRMLDALSAAHASGVLHRDVKPANVLLTDDGRVLLTDFGIATVAGDDALTRTGFLSGSPGYIAPERLRGEPDGPGSDLWSLGATLFTAVEGAPPFARPSPAAAMAAVLTQAPAPSRLAGPLVPVLSAILEKDPARRCSPAQAVAALEAIAGEAGTELDRTAPGRLRRRRRTPIVLGALLAVVLTVAAVAVVLPRVFPYTPPIVYRYTPPMALPSASGTAGLFKKPFEACDLLTPGQAGKVLGGPVKEQFFSEYHCSWTGPDSSRMVVMAYLTPNVWGAEQFYDIQVKSMKQEPRRTPGTKVRAGPDVGDEAFSFTQRNRFSFMRKQYNSDLSFRLANVAVSIKITGSRPGFTDLDRAAAYVERAVEKLR